MDAPLPVADGPDVTALRGALADGLKKAGFIRSPHVEAAFRAVPRHLFLPGVDVQRAYRDEHIVVKRVDGVDVSTASQPAMMAIMLEQLELQPGQRVLEIGAGTGYNAALLAHIVGEMGRVVSIDLDDDLVAQAREHLAAAGVAGVTVARRDGALGYAEAAPYDRVMLTVASWDIAPAWWEQLTPAGRLLLPLMLPRGMQQSILCARDGADGYLVSRSLSPCMFIPLRGAAAHADQAAHAVVLGPPPGLTLRVADPGRIDAEATYTSLHGPAVDLPTGVVVAEQELSRLWLWLALREPDAIALDALAEVAVAEAIPYLLGEPGEVYRGMGLAAEGRLCVLHRDRAPNQVPSELVVRRFGPDAALGRRLVAQIRGWDAAGRPGDQAMRMRVRPREAAATVPAGGLVIQKQWTQLMIDWL